MSKENDRKVALCLSGQMRTYKKCYGYLKTNIIDPLEPDIFIHTWRGKGSSTKVDSGTQSDTIQERDLERLYEPEDYKIEKFKQDYFEEKGEIKVPEELKEKSDGHWKGNIPLFYKMKKCNELKTGKEQEENFKYDVVIKLRPDMIITQEIPEKVLSNPQMLWHSDCKINESFQVSDKFAVSSSQNMDYYTSVWNSLSEYWEKPLGNGEWQNYRVGERLIFHHMRNSEIETRTFHVAGDILRSEEYLKQKYRNSTEELVRMIYRKLKQIRNYN